MLTEIRDDDIGACLDESLALRLVDAVAAYLVRGDADSHPADGLGILDLDVAVTEGQKVAASQLDCPR